MRKIIFIFILFVSCSSNKEIGVATLSDANKESERIETISEEDYPLILTECLNTKGYDIQTPFDIEDLKSMLAQMTGNEKGKDEKNEIMEDVETCIAENGLWPDRASINPEEQAKRFDESLELAQCLREKGLDVPDPTNENTLRDILPPYVLTGVISANDLRALVRECIKENGYEVPEDLREEND